MSLLPPLPLCRVSIIPRPSSSLSLAARVHVSLTCSAIQIRRSPRCWQIGPAKHGKQGRAWSRGVNVTAPVTAPVCGPITASVASPFAAIIIAVACRDVQWCSRLGMCRKRRSQSGRRVGKTRVCPSRTVTLAHKEGAQIEALYSQRTRRRIRRRRRRQW